MHDADEVLRLSSRTSKSPRRQSLGLTSSTVEKSKSVRDLDPPTQMPSNQRDTLVSLGTEKTIELLEQATTRLCSAARVLQGSKLCCNSFTVIVSRDPSNSDNVADLVSISFQKLENLRDSVLALRKLCDP